MAQMAEIDLEHLPKKIIHDPIHGVLELNEVYISIIDTVQFQRLRNIKQLGGVQYVYPSATHSRFEHSLGVCYLAEMMTKTLQRKQPELKINDTDILCVGIAGLCHDLGHGPFSHSWENFMKRAKPDNAWQHEITSFNMFEYLWNNFPPDKRSYLNSTDLKFIQELITGVPYKEQQPHEDEKEQQNWPFKGRSRMKSFLYDIVSNKKNGVDVDKWDYFLRDCYYLGFKETFDYRRLLQSARVIEDKDGIRYICFRDKEVLNLYDMFHTRWEIHRKACYHRVSRIIEEMIVDALLQVDELITISGAENGDERYLSECCDHVVNFSHLDDTVLDRILFESHPQRLENLQEDADKRKLTEAKDLITRIKTRKLYKEVCYAFLDKQTDEEAKKILEDARKTLAHRADACIRLDEINYGKKDKDPIQDVKFYNKKNVICPMVNQNFGSEIIPSQFKQQMVSCICKSDSPKDQDEVRSIFVGWCGKLVAVYS